MSDEHNINDDLKPIGAHAKPAHMKPAPEPVDTPAAEGGAHAGSAHGDDAPAEGRSGQRIAAGRRAAAASSASAAEDAPAGHTAHPSEPASPADPAKKRRATLLKVLIAVFLLVAVGCGGYVVYMHQLESQRAQEMADSDKPATKVEKKGEELPANPIDFGSLISENADIYAWLYIPCADINTPVLQSQTDDLFYLDHDKDGSSDPYGTAFSQMVNNRDFSDPVTVIYGHVNGGVFQNLHDFEDADFFNENKEFYIYTPGHVLTYKVIAAYQYDDRHIMNSFDFSNEDVRQQYFNSVLNPDALLKNVREGVTLDANSKIVQLSTCMLDSSQSNSRYIVTGLLTNDQETK